MRKGYSGAGKGNNRSAVSWKRKKKEEAKWISKKQSWIPQPFLRALKKSFQAKNCRSNKKLKSFGDGRGGRKHARPATQTVPADSRRSARPQLLAGYRALEPQQSLRTGPQ
jgi:hypothetical protein